VLTDSTEGASFGTRIAEGASAEGTRRERQRLSCCRGTSVPGAGNNNLFKHQQQKTEATYMPVKSIQ